MNVNPIQPDSINIQRQESEMPTPPPHMRAFIPGTYPPSIIFSCRSCALGAKICPYSRAICLLHPPSYLSCRRPEKSRFTNNTLPRSTDTFVPGKCTIHGERGGKCSASCVSWKKVFESIFPVKKRWENGDRPTAAIAIKKKKNKIRRDCPPFSLQ